MPVQPLLALDSATMYYRSFFALPESMTAPAGHPHNAVRGFLQTLTRLIVRFQPRGALAAWDVDWRPDWRVDLIDSYKTHRLALEGESDEGVPDTLGPQIGAIADILKAWGLPVLGAVGAEADDVIGTLSATRSTGDLLIVVTSDRDLLQVVSPGVSLLQMANGGLERWALLDPRGVEERYGIPPKRYVDFAVLRGDPSDGLPGVRGIGEKTAASLIAAFGSLDALLEAAAHNPIRPLTPRLAASLIDACDYIQAARAVVAVRRDVDLPEVPKSFPSVVHDSARLRGLAVEWGIERYVDELLVAAQTVLE
jgi:5'-3' exonuclease